MSCLPPNPLVPPLRLPPYPSERYDLSALREIISNLTLRQSAVLAWATYGSTNLEIADRLGVGIKTVEGELTKILGMLQVPTRLDAAVMWTLVTSTQLHGGAMGSESGNQTTPAAI